MARKYTTKAPDLRPAKEGPPQTTSGNIRAFDMRPKSTDQARRDEARYRAPRSSEPALDDPEASGGDS